MKFIKITDGVFGSLNKNKGNIYLIKDKSNNILIDCGARSYKNKLELFLNYCDISIIDITHIFITHGDGDHIGNLYKFSNNQNVKIILNKLTYENYIKKSVPVHFPKIISTLMRFFMFYNVKDFLFSNIYYLKEDMMIDIAGGIRAIYTPGHTNDHYSFYLESKRILFTGDILYGKKNSYFVPPKIINSNHSQLLESISKALQLSPKIIACGHGDVLFT